MIDLSVRGEYRIWGFPEMSWAHPVITGGRMYLREQNKLMCYDVSDAS